MRAGDEGRKQMMDILQRVHGQHQQQDQEGLMEALQGMDLSQGEEEDEEQEEEGDEDDEEEGEGEAGAAAARRLGALASILAEETLERLLQKVWVEMVMCGGKGRGRTFEPGPPSCWVLEGKGEGQGSGEEGGAALKACGAHPCAPRAPCPFHL